MKIAAEQWVRYEASNSKKRKNHLFSARSTSMSADCARNAPSANRLKNRLLRHHEHDAKGRRVGIRAEC